VLCRESECRCQQASKRRAGGHGWEPAHVREAVELRVGENVHEQEAEQLQQGTVLGWQLLHQVLEVLDLACHTIENYTHSGMW